MRRYRGQEIRGDGMGWDGDLVDGDYYLIDVSPQTGSDYWDFSLEPGRKNMSGEICYDGWLGSTNNVSRTADGAVRVANGRVRRVDVEDLVAAEECEATD